MVVPSVLSIVALLVPILLHPFAVLGAEQNHHVRRLKSDNGNGKGQDKPNDGQGQNKQRVFITFAIDKKQKVKDNVKIYDPNEPLLEFDFESVNQGAIVVELPQPAIDAMSKNKNKDFFVIEEDPVVDLIGYYQEQDETVVNGHPFNVRRLAQEIPYGIDMVQALEVSEDGSGVKVCVIDSGADFAHQDLPLNRMGGDTGTDACHHGTHVLGTIAAQENSLGVVGVAPGVDVWIEQVFIGGSVNMCPGAYMSTIMAAAQSCRDNGAKIINMSLGGSSYLSSADSFFQSLMEADDVLTVAAAGNSGSRVYHYPASYDSVVSVAAVTSQEVRASYSTYNDKVSVAAPGSGVKSTIPGDDYSIKSGTSMATPHVVGVAALAWQAHPSQTATQIKARLEASAKDLGPPGKDEEYGWGLVDAWAAVNAVACSSNLDCDDSNPNTIDTCSLNGFCLNSIESTVPVIITWDVSTEVSNSGSGIYSEFALDSSAPTRTADSNYNGPDIYGGLHRNNQGSWNIGNKGASGMRVRFEQSHKNQSTAGLFLFKMAGSFQFSASSDILSADEIHTNWLERLSSATIRFVFEEKGSFYISESSSNFAEGSGTGNQLFSFSISALSASWFSYDPTGSADSVSASFFTNVGMVGFTLFATSADVTDARLNYGVRALTISGEQVKTSASPSSYPSSQPTSGPTGGPSASPTAHPSASPSVSPSLAPTAVPSARPSMSPSSSPSGIPSVHPSTWPSSVPSFSPSNFPSSVPSSGPTANPSIGPSTTPSASPSIGPSTAPSASPSTGPSRLPTEVPSGTPSIAPSVPSEVPSSAPSEAPSVSPTISPSCAPSLSPSGAPSVFPSELPTGTPTSSPTVRFNDVTIHWDATTDVSNPESSTYPESALDTTTPLRVAANVGLDVYGALDKNSKGSWNVQNDGGSGMRIRFDAGNTGGHSCTGLFLIKPQNPLMFRADAQTLSASEIFTNKMERLESASMRFVVQDNGNFFISEPSPDFGAQKNRGYTTDSWLLQALSASWYNYDPLSSADLVSVIGTLANPSLNDISFVGFALFATSPSTITNAAVNFGVRELLIEAKEWPMPPV